MHIIESLIFQVSVPSLDFSLESKKPNGSTMFVRTGSLGAYG